MGIHRRGGRSYGYRSVRQGSRVRKVYLGSGAFAKFAGRLGRLRDFEEGKTKRRWKRSKERIEVACGEFDELDAGCELLRDAALLVAGFYRSERHPWRKRKHGLRVFQHREDA